MIPIHLILRGAVFYFPKGMGHQVMDPGGTGITYQPFFSSESLPEWRVAVDAISRLTTKITFHQDFIPDLESEPSKRVD